MDCNNLRRYNYYFFDTNGRRVDNVRFYDITTGLEVSSRMASRCLTVQTVNVACATVC